jgi:hypothetical protein
MNLIATFAASACAWCSKPAGWPRLVTHDNQPICAECVRRHRVHPVSVLSESGLSRRYRGGYRPPRSS